MLEVQVRSLVKCKGTEHINDNSSHTHTCMHVTETNSQRNPCLTFHLGTLDLKIILNILSVGDFSDNVASVT